MPYAINRSQPRNVIAAFALVLVAGCGASIGSSQGIPSLPEAPLSAGVVAAWIPDLTPPACKGQTKTKQYASLNGQHVTPKGGSVCVPAFGGWGGSLQLPPSNGYATIGLISSTTAYEPGLFPPPGSKAPVFYLQFALSMDLTFGSTLPYGNGISSAAIVPKRTYTAEAALDFGSLWEYLGGCYSVAKKTKYGGSIGRVGGVFRGHGLNHSNGVIEIFSGKLVANAC